MRMLRWIVSLLIIAAGFLPVAAAATHFADVPDTHPYAEAIEMLRQREIVQGFVVPGEHTVFWPASPVTRAEFVQMLAKALAPQVLIDSCLTDAASLDQYGLGMPFADVSTDAWYAPAVCVSWSYRFVSGYGDGSFRPDRPITLAEGAKIFSTAFSLAPLEIPDLTVLGTEWYKPYIHYMDTAGAIPDTAQDYAHVLSRGEVAEMLARLLKLPSDKPPEQRIALAEDDVKNPVDWTAMVDLDRGFSFSYPNSWPAPHLVARSTYSGDIQPKLSTLWSLFAGPERDCWGGSACIERDFSLTAFDRSLGRRAIEELNAATSVSILSDETVEDTRTILFEEETSNCTVRSAYLFTHNRFLRLSLHCGSDLHDPETAFMRLLGRLQVLGN